ncbi:MAG: hypothetical protein ACK5NF_08060, partial [Bacilli bacterium]
IILTNIELYIKYIIANPGFIANIEKPKNITTVPTGGETSANNAPKITKINTYGFINLLVLLSVLFFATIEIIPFSLLGIVLLSSITSWSYP